MINGFQDAGALAQPTYAGVAQLVELLPSKQKVTSSNLVARSIRG